MESWGSPRRQSDGKEFQDTRLAAEAALGRVARRARELGRKTGTPVYVLRNGRIVDLTKEWKRRSQPR